MAVESRRNKVILFNPRSANSKYRIPNSILQVGASIHGRFEYVFVDGNLEKEPWQVIEKYLNSGEYKYFGTTVMPGPQLNQAIPFAQKAKQIQPRIINIWGGYFPSNQYEVTIQSPYIDFIINGPGDQAFPALLEALEYNKPYEFIPNLIFSDSDGQPVLTRKAVLVNQDQLPPLPYDYLDRFYPLNRYLGKTFLGQKTLAYHSSVGCPFTCSFCAVVPIYEARWSGKSAARMCQDILYFKEKYGADAIEFHDNNFFVSESRVVDFSKRILGKNMNWWGEGRIDTVDRYSDSSLSLIRESGCKMIFFGAESGNNEILKEMDKGGKQSREQIMSFAARMKKFDIIPEYSFVVGMPAATPEKVMEQIDADLLFIKTIKEINPQTEIIIYVYSPVPTKGSALYNKISSAGFAFPEKLEDWLSPQWQSFDLRKNPLTPWLTKEMVNKIKNFETVLNAFFPTISDIKLSTFQRRVMRLISSLRYHNNFIHYPYELKALQKFWLKYRQPEMEGF